jgi:hypothetical protein
MEVILFYKSRTLLYYLFSQYQIAIADSCKFLHDRGDYKSGWQLEKEWDDKQRKKKMQLEDSLKKFSKGMKFIMD